MAYGFNEYRSNSYMNKRERVSSQPTPGFGATSNYSYEPSSQSYSPTSYSATRYQTSNNLYEKYEKKKRSGLDRIGDALSVGSYVGVGLLHAAIDPNLGAFESTVKALKSANPFGEDFTEGEYTYTDYLSKTGWNPESTLGKVARGVVGFAGDIVFDPLTYVTFGASAVAKGTGKVVAKGIGKSATKQVAKSLTPEMAEAWLKYGGMDASKEAVEGLIKRSNSVAGIANTGTSSGLGVKFGKYQKTFIDEDTLRMFGDKTIAPYVNAIPDYLQGLGISKRLDAKQALKKMARTDIDQVARDLIATDIKKKHSTELAKTVVATRKRVSDIFKDVPLDEQDEIFKHLEDTELWAENIKRGNINDTATGKELIEKWQLQADNTNKRLSDIKKLLKERTELTKELKSGPEAIANKIEMANLTREKNIIDGQRALIKNTQDKIKDAQRTVNMFVKENDGTIINKFKPNVFTSGVDETGKNIIHKVPFGWEIKGEGLADATFVKGIGPDRKTYRVGLVNNSTLGDLNKGYVFDYNNVKSGKRSYGTSQKSVEKFLETERTHGELLAKAQQLVRDTPIIADQFKMTGFNTAMSEKQLTKFIKEFNGSNPLDFINESYKYMDGYNIASKIAYHKFPKVDIPADPSEIFKTISKPSSDVVQAKRTYEAAVKASKKQFAQRQDEMWKYIGDPELAIKDWKKHVDDIEAEKLGLLKETKSYKELASDLEKAKLHGDPGAIEHALEEIKRFQKAIQKTYRSKLSPAEMAHRDFLTGKDGLTDSFINYVEEIGDEFGKSSYKASADELVYDIDYDFKSDPTFTDNLADALDTGATFERGIIEEATVTRNTAQKRYLDKIIEAHGEGSDEYFLALEKLGKVNGETKESYKELVDKLAKTDTAKQASFRKLPLTRDEALKMKKQVAKAADEVARIEIDVTKTVKAGKVSRAQARELNEYLKLDYEGLGAKLDAKDAKLARDYKRNVMQKYFPDKRVKDLNKAEKDMISDMMAKAEADGIIPKADRDAFYDAYLEQSDMKIKELNPAFEEIQRNQLRTEEGYWIHSEQVRNKISQLDDEIRKLHGGTSRAELESKAKELGKVFRDGKVDDYAKQVLGESYEQYITRTRVAGSMLDEAMAAKKGLTPETSEKLTEIREMLNEFVTIEESKEILNYAPHIVKDKYRGLVSDYENVVSNAMLGSDGRPFLANKMERRLKYTVDEYHKLWDAGKFKDTDLPRDLFEEDIVSALTERAIRHDNYVYSKDNAKTILKLTSTPFIPGRAYDKTKRFVIPREDLIAEIRKRKLAKAKELGILEDAFKATGKKKVNQTITTDMVREIFEKDGVKFNFHKDSPYIEVLEGAQTIERAPNGLRVRVMKDGTFDHFNQLSSYQIKEGTQKMLDVYDKCLTLWKKNVTVVNPAFHARNVVGNMFNSYLDIGTKAFSFKERKRISDLLTGKYTDDIITKTGKKYTSEEVVQIARQYGAVDEGFFGEMQREVMKHGHSPSADKWAKYNPLNPTDFAPYKIGTRAGSVLENQDKMLNFVHHIENGLSPSEAAERTATFLFNYDEATAFEKEVLRRAIPFWTWAKKNIPLQMKNVIDQPGKYRPFIKGMRAIDQSNTGDESYDFEKPRFAQDWVRLPVGKNGNPAIFNPNMPFADLSPDVQGLLSKLSPFIKVPIELATEKNMYTGTPIKKSNDKIGHIAKQIGPVANWAKINDKDGNAKLLEILAQLTGAKVLSYEQEKYNYEKVLNDFNYENKPGR